MDLNSSTSSIDLTRDAYNEVGGVQKALSNHADEVYAELVVNKKGQLVERLFRSLTARGTGDQQVRRPIPVKDAAAIAECSQAEIIAVVEAFRRTGRTFLMPPPDVELTADSIIDISHESLIRQWHHLRSWVQTEQDSVTRFRRLVATVQLHSRGEGELLRGRELEAYLAWQENEQPTSAWADCYEPGTFADALAFLESSRQEEAHRQEAEARQAAEEEARRERELEAARELASAQLKRARVFRRMLAVAAVTSVVAFSMFLWAYSAQKEAQEQTHEAERQRQRSEASLVQANHSYGLALLERSRKHLSDGRYTRAFLGAGKAVGFENYGEGRALLKTDTEEYTRASTIMQYCAPHALTPRKIAGLATYVHSVAISPDALRIAVGASSSLQVQHLDTGAVEDTYELPLDSYAAHVEFSPDGKSLIWAGSSHAGVIDLGNDTQSILETGAVLYDIACSRDGTMIAWGGADGRLKIYNTDSKEQETFAVSPAGITAVEISADSGYVGWATENGKVYVGRLKSGQVAHVDTTNGFVWSLAFRPETNVVTAVSYDGTLRHWEYADRMDRLIETYEARNVHADQVRSLEYSGDGKYYVSASYDGTAKVWLSESGQLVQTIDTHNGGLSSGRFLPGESIRVVTSGADGNVLVSTLPKRTNALPALRGHTREIVAIEYHPNGHRIATGAWDSTLRIWDPRTGESQVLIDLRGQQNGEKFTQVCFGKKGNILCAATDSGTVVVLRSAGSTDNYVESFRFTVGKSDWVVALGLSLSAQMLAVGHGKGHITIVDPDTGDTLAVHKSRDHAVGDLEFIDGDKLLVYVDGHRRVFGLETDDWSERWQVSVGANSRTWSHVCEDNGVIYTCSFGTGSIQGFNSVTRTVETLWGPKPGQPAQQLLDFEKIPNANLFVLTTGSRAPSIRLWNSHSREMTMIMPESHGYLRNVAVHPEGTMVAYPSADHSIRFLPVKPTNTQRVDVNSFRFEGVESVFDGPESPADSPKIVPAGAHD